MSSADALPAARASLSVSFQDVSKQFGSVRAVDHVSLEIEAGEFVSILGPSGSGKTTLLMMLAGFDEPTDGRIVVGGRDITRVPPNERNIGMVFQSYALFPHMNVADNIAFPLRMRRLDTGDRAHRVRRALEMVRLEGYETRMPSQLSGGQQQRVALARAIVFNPSVILMDEPLGALDKKLREHLQFEIKQLQSRLAATVVYVTHDQGEALTMSDRIAVMNHGRVLQVGKPREVYEQPTSTFVANFLGEMNFVSARIASLGPQDCVVVVEGQMSEARFPPDAPRPAIGDEVHVAIRPECLRMRPVLGPAGPGLTGRVQQIVFNGAALAVMLRLGDGSIVRADASSRSAVSDLAVDDWVGLSWTGPDALVFSKGG